MVRGYKVPWIYQRFGQIAHRMYREKYLEDAPVPRDLDYSDTLRAWGEWQEKVWDRRPEAKPVAMPANTRSLSTQTELGPSDMRKLDDKLEHLDEVLDFYVKRSSSAFEEDLMIAFDNAQGYCKHCSHCKAELKKRRVANLHKWRYPNCKCGHPFADKRLRQGF